MASSSSAPDLVSTTLNYFTPPADGSAPWSIAKFDPVTGKSPSNWEPKKFDVQIENLRGKESSASLDTTGFAYFEAPTKAQFTDDTEIQEVYYPESVELLKRFTGATKVVLFDHTIRQVRVGEADNGPDKRQPALLAHVDQTPAAAAIRVRRHVPDAEEAERLLKGRYQIINLWRPIAVPAVDHPLALCDFRSIDKERDLVPLKLTFPTYVGETFAVNYNPAHKWKYVRGMRPDEIVLIKCFDSDTSVATLTPHTAFVDPTTPKDAPGRQSIELRALVFY